MPYKTKLRRCSRCGRTHDTGASLCSSCSPALQNVNPRLSASARGYDHTWRKIRESVLRDAGIPEDQWPLYDVDHNPPYNPSIEPDHTAYTLIPRLKSSHSHKTATEDTPRDYHGRFTRKGGGSKSLQNSHIDRGVQVSLSDVKTKARGS